MSNRWGRDGDLGPLAAVLPAVAERIGMPLPPGAEEAWSLAVGEGIARHSRPRSMRDGVLRIEVDAPSWLKILEELHSVLAERLCRQGLSVRRVELRLLGPG